MAGVEDEGEEAALRVALRQLEEQKASAAGYGGCRQSASYDPAPSGGEGSGAEGGGGADGDDPFQLTAIDFPWLRKLTKDGEASRWNVSLPTAWHLG
ncbi:unnamed protein product [Urochloa humidicola]